MKIIISVLILLFIINSITAQQLPSLPIPIGAGTCEVWNNSIYHFGGSNNWGASVCYPLVYKFDGTSWQYYDSIPDNNMWGVTSVLVGDYVYIFGGWPSGYQLNRRYNLNSNEWDYLASNPGIFTLGITAEVLDGFIYLFLLDGECFAYNIASDTWTNKTSNTVTGTGTLRSVLYQNEIYIIGWNNSGFCKYNPTTDQWTQLANSLYPVGACGMGIINKFIYCVGGSSGSAVAEYNTILKYDITTNTWDLDTKLINSKRNWMATAEYKGGLYVVGGFDSLANAVDVVEEIVSQGTASVDGEILYSGEYSLFQNYPNPFNPVTSIQYAISSRQLVMLKVYNILGTEIESLVNEEKPSGTYEVTWYAEGLPSGVYFYRLKAGSFIETKKMVLLR